MSALTLSLILAVRLLLLLLRQLRILCAAEHLCWPPEGSHHTCDVILAITNVCHVASPAAWWSLTLQSACCSISCSSCARCACCVCCARALTAATDKPQCACRQQRSGVESGMQSASCGYAAIIAHALCAERLRWLSSWVVSHSAHVTRRAALRSLAFQITLR